MLTDPVHQLVDITQIIEHERYNVSDTLHNTSIHCQHIGQNGSFPCWVDCYPMVPISSNLFDKLYSLQVFAPSELTRQMHSFTSRD